MRRRDFVMQLAAACGLGAVASRFAPPGWFGDSSGPERLTFPVFNRATAYEVGWQDPTMWPLGESVVPFDEAAMVRAINEDLAAYNREFTDVLRELSG